MNCESYNTAIFDKDVYGCFDCFCSFKIEDMKTQDEIKERIRLHEKSIYDNITYLSDYDCDVETKSDILKDNVYFRNLIDELKWVLKNQ